MTAAKPRLICSVGMQHGLGNKTLVLPKELSHPEKRNFSERALIRAMDPSGFPECSEVVKAILLLRLPVQLFAKAWGRAFCPAPG